MGRLVRSDPAAPGIRRVRRGRGFSYADARGRPVGPDDLERIRALALPPAWTDVWICVHPRGHIQATGRDAAGRLQYRYHDDWRTRRDALKHERVTHLAMRLPDIRARVAADLRRRGLPRERVLALAFRLLDLGSFRIGSEEYAQANGTFGLATLRRDHVTVSGSRIEVRFTAKGSQDLAITVADRSAARVVTALLAREDKDPDLLAWQEDDTWRDVRSRDINEYLRQISGMPVSAKDLRTWNATVLMALALDRCGAPPATERERRRVVRSCLDEVSSHLGNTATVARNSYVDRRLIDLWLGGEPLDLPRPATPDVVDRRVAALLMAA